MASPHEELIFELDRVLPAERGRVFGAFADARQLAQWWGPAGFEIPAARLDKLAAWL